MVTNNRLINEEDVFVFFVVLLNSNLWSEKTEGKAKWDLQVDEKDLTFLGEGQRVTGVTGVTTVIPHGKTSKQGWGLIDC